MCMMSGRCEGRCEWGGADHCNSQTLHWTASSLPNNKQYWRCLSNITVSSPWTKYYKKSIEIDRQAPPPCVSTYHCITSPCAWQNLPNLPLSFLPTVSWMVVIVNAQKQGWTTHVQHYDRYARSLNERQLYEEQLRKEMVLLGSLTNSWIRPAAWMHFVHDMAVPISRSPQCSWWGLVLAETCPVDDFV